MAVTKLPSFPQGKYNVSHQKQAEGGADLLAGPGQPQAFKKLPSCGRSAREQFQVVWTNLAFEVRLSTYDRLVSRTFARVKSLAGGARGAHYERPLHAGQLEPGARPASLCSKPSEALQLGADRRVIFDNINGYIKSGELSAILGPSGSGKTSLLNALCGRTHNYRGRIQLVGAGSRRMRLSIIPQKDYLIENLTVKENLLYSSRLLNVGRGFDHEAKILRVVRMLNLAACFESLVANISGGEYKRVSIAQELLLQPDILVLDEPTSGLDSLNCKNLISSLVELVGASRAGHIKPIAIVMTIHQPDVDIFHMFDHVYCMARGGRVIYDGRPSEAMRVIGAHTNLVTDERPPRDTREPENSSVGYRPRAPPAGPTQVPTNPANLLIEIASEDLHGREPIERLARHQLEQFEELRESWTPKHSPGGLKKLTQLQANFLSTSQAHQKNILPSKELATPTADSDPPPPARTLTSPLTIHDGSPRSTSASPSLASSRASNVNASPLTSLVRDKRLNAKNDHTGLFWYHTGVLAQRAFLSTLRDPLLTLISLVFHLSIPFVMYTVYPRKIGHTHGCPLTDRELDLISMSSERISAKLEDLQEEVTTTIECSTMFFLTTYSFSMCSLSVAALAFPLNMHILLKEVRNGWYNLPTYVVAKTIANFPFEVLFPVLSLVMIYVMLGMPSSPYEWRLWAIAMVMALVSMISHTQGLIFGALCMDSVQTAIFLASASSLPQTLLSGFTARIKHMPWLLQKLSWLSQYRYSSDLINMVRFGFDTCPCDGELDELLRTSKPTFEGVRENMKHVFLAALETQTFPYQQDANNASLAADNATSINSINASELVNPVTSTMERATLRLGDNDRRELLRRMNENEVDLFGRLADTMSRSFSYGHPIDSCESVRSQILVIGGTPSDNFLPTLFGCMLLLLVTVKFVLFVAVRSKVGSRV